jgi:hypothetical protein
VAPNYGPKIVTDGLVLCLDAANRKSYPGSGTTWFDLSNNVNNGSLTSVDYDSPSRSLVFDTASDTALVNHSSILNFSSRFTVSAWIRVNSFSTASIYNVVSKKPSFNNTQKGWSCQYDYRTTGVLQYRNNDGSTLNDHTPTSSVNNTSLLNQTTDWVNSVWVINNNIVSFYINSVLKSSLTINYIDTDTTTGLYIGKTVGSIGDPSLLMNLSNVSLYNKSLSAEEVLQNFNALKGRHGL